jgi:hypothetical protein
MAQRERRGFWEWRIIRIPISTIRFWVFFFLFLLVAGGITAVIALDLIHKSGPGRSVLVWWQKSLSSFGASVPPVDGDGGGAQTRQRTATVHLAKGKIEVLPSGAVSWISASEGSALGAGDKIRTYSGASAEVRFDDGSVLNIKADSLIIMKNMEQDVRTKVTRSSVRVVKADLEASIQKPNIEGSEFIIETSDSVATIRERSRLQVASTEGAGSSFRVIQGLVRLVSGETSVEVGDLVAVSVSPSGSISPRRPLPAPPILSSPGPLETVAVADAASGKVVFSWVPPAGGGTYALSIARKRDFSDLVYERPGITTNAFQVAGLGEGVYFWRVATHRGDLDGPASTGRALRIVEDRIAPMIDVEKMVVSRTGSDATLLLEGATEPDTRLLLDGRPLRVDETGRFSLVGPLPAGQVKLVLEGVDPFGNKSRIEKEIR